MHGYDKNFKFCKNDECRPVLLYNKKRTIMPIKQFFICNMTFLIGLLACISPCAPGAQVSPLAAMALPIGDSSIACVVNRARGMDSYPHTDPLPELYEKGLSKEERNKLLSQVDDESRKIFMLTTSALNTEKLPIVGYGSLINPKSAKITLSDSDTIERSAGVYIYGYRRAFSAFYPFPNRRIRPSDPKNAIAALNIMQIDDPAEYFNGVLYWVDMEDFVALRRRETIYDLVPVATISYGSEDTPFIAYAWSVGEPEYVRDNITPSPTYYAVVWEAVNSDGARMKLGDNVAGEYLDTTFLANGDSIRLVHEELSQIEPIY